MVKKRSEFMNESDYLDYLSTIEFKENYSIEGKTVFEVIADMVLPLEWMPYIEKVYEENNRKKRYEGIYFYYDVERLVIDDEDYESQSFRGDEE